MAKRLLTSALLIDWRAQLPPSSTKARGAWRVLQSAQVIPWRAYLGPATAGGGPATGLALRGESDGTGGAQVEITGPPDLVEGEADGRGNAQISLIVGQSLLAEADGSGDARCVFDGGVVSITCITTGTVSGSPPTPHSTILYDTPSSW
jgi:hypothetical protein